MTDELNGVWKSTQLASLGSLAAAPGALSEALALVSQVGVSGADQLQLQSDFLAFMADEPDCLFRYCEPGHLTSSAVVIDPARGQTLLLKHRKLQRWLQPGGHADGDGNLAYVALKEATEETGIVDLGLLAGPIDLDIHVIPANARDPQHRHYDVRFLVVASENSQVSANDESTDARWFSPDDQLIVGNPDLERVVARAFEVAAEAGLLRT